MIRVIEKLPDEAFLTLKLAYGHKVGCGEYFLDGPTLYLASEDPQDFAVLSDGIPTIGGDKVQAKDCFLNYDGVYYCYFEYEETTNSTLIGCVQNDGYCIYSFETIKSLENITLAGGEDHSIFLKDNGKIVHPDQRHWVFKNYKTNGTNFPITVDPTIELEFVCQSMGRRYFTVDCICYYDAPTNDIQIRSNYYTLDKPERITISRGAEYFINERLPANYKLTKDFVIELDE